MVCVSSSRCRELVCSVFVACSGYIRSLLKNHINYLSYTRNDFNATGIELKHRSLRQFWRTIIIKFSIVNKKK